MDYIYKIEVEYFLRDGKYHWRLKHKKENSPLLTWQVCATGCSSNTAEAWFDAMTTLQKIENNSCSKG